LVNPHSHQVLIRNTYQVKNERKRKMANKPLYKVGDTFTTLKSKVTGVIKEIHPSESGSTRILLDVNGKNRWTTFKMDN